MKALRAGLALLVDGACFASRASWWRISMQYSFFFQQIFGNLYKKHVLKHKNGPFLTFLSTNFDGKL